MPKNKRVLFIFACPWEKEVEAVQRGEKPGHRLFAYQEFLEAGYQARYSRCPKWLQKKANENWHLWTLYSNLIAALTAWRYQDIIGVQENAVWFLLYLKRMHLVWSRVTVVNVALLKEENLSGRRFQAWQFLLGGADRIISYSSDQKSILHERFGVESARSLYTPYGVDTKFFDAIMQDSPGLPTAPSQGVFQVVAAGSAGRDYETLIAAVDGMTDVTLDIYCMPDVLERLRRSVPELPKNARLHLGNLSYIDLTRLYLRADCIAIPVKDTLYSAGQTVILEAMVCGRPVITSNVIGTRDYIESGVNGPSDNGGAIRWRCGRRLRC